MTTTRKVKLNYFFMLLGGIIVIAFILRLWGINFGLPYEYHVDEVQYVRQAASMGEKGLEPTLWNNPPLLKYIFLAEYGVVYVVGKVLGIFSSPSSFGATYNFDPSLLYLVARGTNTIISSLTVLLMGLIGRHIFNDNVGLISAWLLAVCFIHVRDSHFAVNDVLATFLMLFTIFAALKILVKNENKWYMLAGIGVGLGFATKYTAFFSAFPVIFAHFLAEDVRINSFSRQNLFKLILFVIVALGSSVLASPYFIITPGKVLNGINEFLYIPGKSGFDWWEIDPAGGYVFYIKSLLWGLGYAQLLLVIIGIVLSVFNRSKTAVVILSLPVLLYIYMGRQEMYFSRFIIPIIPPFLLWSAKVFDDVVVKWAVLNRRLFCVVPALVLLITVQPFLNSIRLDILLAQTDTRTLAKEWIENNLPAGSKIAFDWPVYSPPLSSQDKKYPNNNKVYDVIVLNGSGLFEKPTSWYKEQGFDYIVTSSFISDISLSNKDDDMRRKLFYKNMDNEFILIKTFSPVKNNQQIEFVFDEIYGPMVSLWQRERPGPILKIYKLPE